MAELAKQVQSEIDRARSGRARCSPRGAARAGGAVLGELPFATELGQLEDALRYSLLGGGKRIRPVLCLATGEALGRDPDEVLPAACSLELVHTFSLVHDDLPALDDDDLRRGQPSSHIRFGEDVAILAGDALLAEAFAWCSATRTRTSRRELRRRRSA